jgi:hypothetical protein
MERLERFRAKDPVLDGLLRGDLLTPSRAHNDERLMTILLYRCFSMAEIVAIMASWPHGDLVERAARGPKYWHWLRRKILAIDEFRYASRAHVRDAGPDASRVHAREQSGNSAREK